MNGEQKAVVIYISTVFGLLAMITLFIYIETEHKSKRKSYELQSIECLKAGRTPIVRGDSFTCLKDNSKREGTF